MVEEKERIGTLQQIRIRKHELLERLEANKAEHRGQFERAIEGYKKAVVEQLEALLEEARTKKPQPMPFPKDHTDDYDRIIAMVKASVDDLFQLSVQEFAMYVLDEWDWKGQFTTSVAAYAQS